MTKEEIIELCTYCPNSKDDEMEIDINSMTPLFLAGPGENRNRKKP